jgi:hypothetical protein
MTSERFGFCDNQFHDVTATIRTPPLWLYFNKPKLQGDLCNLHNPVDSTI